MIKKLIPFLVISIIAITTISFGKLIHKKRDLVFWVTSVFSDNPKIKVKYLSKAIDVNTEFTYLLIDRAWAHAECQEYDKAISDFLQFRDKYPHRIESWFGEAYIYEKKGDKDKALSIYSTAIGIEKTSVARFPWVYEKRGKLLYELGHIKDGRIDLIEFYMITDNQNSALSLLNEWIDEKDSAHARELRGKIYQRLKEYNKAYIDFSKVMELAPDYGWGSIYRARLNYKMKNLKAAFTDLDEIISKIPEFSEAYLQRAEYYISIKETKKAITDYKQAFEVYKKYNLIDEANSTMNKIRSINSTNS